MLKIHRIYPAPKPGIQEIFKHSTAHASDPVCGADHRYGFGIEQCVQAVPADGSPLHVILRPFTLGILGRTASSAEAARASRRNLECLLILRHIFGKKLQRDAGPRLGVLGLLHNAHAAAGFFDNAVT
jgi:hypothetical protein